MKKNVIIIIGILLFTALVVVIWEWLHVKTTTMEEVYILPKNFKGVALIVYDQKDGLEDVVEDGKLIYRIPKNGVLKLKRKSASTLSQAWYYFEDEQNQRTEFQYSFDPNEMKKNKDKIYAFGKSNGGYENNEEKIRITTFLVGTEKDRDSLSKLDEKLNPLELIRDNN